MQYPIVSSIIAHIDAYIYQLSSFAILAVPSPENIYCMFLFSVNKLPMSSTKVYFPLD